MTTPARQEIQVLESMRGVSDYCISAVGEPPFIDNSDGYWIMPLWPCVGSSSLLILYGFALLAYGFRCLDTSDVTDISRSPPPVVSAQTSNHSTAPNTRSLTGIYGSTLWNFCCQKPQSHALRGGLRPCFFGHLSHLFYNIVQHRSSMYEGLHITVAKLHVESSWTSGPEF